MNSVIAAIFYVLIWGFSLYIILQLAELGARVPFAHVLAILVLIAIISLKISFKDGGSEINGE